MVADRLSAAAARRIILAAQGFAEPRPAGPIAARHMRRTIERVGLLQLDSVSAVSRSHYLPLFSRLGPYPRELLDRMAVHVSGASAPVPRGAPGRELFEYWGHEASLLPLATQPLLRWRMARADTSAWKGVVAVARDHPDLVRSVLALIETRGAIRAQDTGVTRRTPRAQGDMWNWHAGKVALEYLFFAGRVAVSRRVGFERVYDLPERVLPAAVLAVPDPDDADAQRQLVRIAAAALGVATEPDLGDYFRLPRADSRARVAELADAGELVAVRVEGWKAPAYLWPAARRPRRVWARALLTPFDSLVWARDRTERAFGFRYRIEIYTPAARRVHGYYVLPFLLGDALVGRVDLRSDRAGRVLRVHGAFAEPGVAIGEVAEALAAELRLLAGWLGLDDVEVAGVNGDLAAPVAAALRSAGGGP